MSEQQIEFIGDSKLRAFAIKSFISGLIGLFTKAAFGKTNVELLKSGDLLACQFGIGPLFYFFLIYATPCTVAYRAFIT